MSLIFDHKGIYYDATVPSTLEGIIARALSTSENARARSIIALWCAFALSKYNALQEYQGQLPPRYVLVADQVVGDLSIGYGLADLHAFHRMLQAALKENPDKIVIVKLHPNALQDARRRHFDPLYLSTVPRVMVITKDCHVAHLIQNADSVYSVTSQVGFEALIWGKRVRCFGMPFYAGWGLTDDELQAPDRRRPVTLEQLVHAALVKYPRYIDPVSMQRCEPEVTFRHVGLQRRKRQEFSEQITAIGFSRWKRAFIKAFLQGSNVTFARTLGADTREPSPTAVAVWGSAGPLKLSQARTVLCIEDGFLRSSGLGADLVRPLSLIIDNLGIYYDATRPSRLEQILESQVLDAAAIDRAHALRERLIQLDLTKYNLGKQSWSRPETDQLVLLVVGQVETDASIRLGSPDVKSNFELLHRVRQKYPSAHIVYKPHPDVVAGLRKQGKREVECNTIADEVLAQHVSVNNLIAQVDEVHTMTSLLGFEALLRGAKVICHGLPFYAGWGLTQDKVSCPRRTRKLTLDDLVHGALIEYPRYFNYERSCFVEPEQAVDQLAARAKTGPQGRNLWRKTLRFAIIAWRKCTGGTR
jgi:capsular polysaccharide export protein